MKIYIKRTVTIFLLSMLLFSMPSQAIESITAGQTLSLEDCVSIALNNSPQLKIYENQRDISKTQVNLAKTDYAPTFGIGTGYNTTYADSNNNDAYSVDVSVRQLLYNFGKTGAKIKMQKLNLESAEFNMENAIIDTVYNVKMAYYEVLAAKASKDVCVQNVNINEREFNRTKAFFEEGMKSKIDLVNAEVNLSDAKIQLVNAENAYQAALIRLNNSMFVAGAPDYQIKNTESFNIETPTVEVDLDFVTKVEDIDALSETAPAKYEMQVEKQDLLTDYVFAPYEISMEDAIKKAYENRPDLKALTATVGAMEESLKYYKREYLPELTAKAGYTFREANTYGNNSFNISAGLDIAALNPFATKYKIDEAKLQVELAQNNVELLKQNIFFEVQDAYVNMQQIEKRIPLLATKVRQALENYQLADGRYEVGLGNFLELQDAKNNYNNAQLSFVQAVFQYNTARVKVEKAMGER